MAIKKIYANEHPKYKKKDKDKNIKVAKEPKINPRIVDEWLADGGKDGPYKTPQAYYEAYYGEIDG
jgi:hypothetical protein